MVRSGYSFNLMVDYNYIKVRINNLEVNQFYNWETTTNWRYLGVAISRTYLDTYSFSFATGTS